MDRILRYGNGDIEPVVALPYNGAASFIFVIVITVIGFRH